MNTEQLITRAKIQIQKRNSFFAYLSLFLKFKESKDLPETAGMGVDIKGNCYYKKEFVDKITSGNNTDMLEGVIAHEILHLALLHLSRLGTRDREGWNFATDLTINTLLRSNGFSLPNGCLMPDSYNNSFDCGNGKVVKDIDKKTAEQIYDEFPKVKKKSNYYILSNGKGKGKGKNGNGEGKELGESFDEHIHGKGMTAKEKKEAEKEWLGKVSEAINVSRMRGDVPVGLERMIGELHKEQIDWKALLQKYIINMLPYDYTYAKPHKKSVSVGEYMPDVLREKIDVCVCIDVSGSVGQKELNDFLSEIIGMARAFQERINIRLLTHETEIKNDYAVANGSIEKIKALKIEGGGGTSHIQPFNFIRDNVRDCKAVIFLTDGYSDLNEIDFNEYPFEKIFVINKGGSDSQVKDKRCKVINLKE